MRKIFILLSLCFTYNTQAQLAFQKYYGGPDNDEITGIIAETDHSFFLIGNTISYGQGGGFADVIHMRIDPAGNFVSSRTYGTSNRDLGRFLFKSTNGYLSGGVKLVGTGASDDLYIQKLDNAGNQTNLFFYGDNDPNGDEEIFAMQEIPSLNYYIMFGFDARNAAILQEACFKMVKSDGTHVASRYYGGPGWADCAFDGFFNLSGIYLGGRTNSIGAGGFDGLAIRTANTSPYGIIWQRAIGGVNDDEFLSMKETPSGELICAGYTKSLGATGEDIFVVKLNLLSGDTIWSRRIGGAGNERARYVLPTADGGFILAGHTTSAGAGGEDAFLMKLASNGTTQWAKLYGGPANDGFTTLAIRPSSFGYAAAGYSYSFTNGGSDMYFVATDMSGVSACNEQNWNPANVIVRPTVKTTGLTANSNTHTSQTETFANTTPTLTTNCKCIEERPRVDITGPLQVCRNQTGVIYSIPTITGVVTYNWTATNATIISPLNSTSATINFGTGNAQIIVQAIYGNCSTFNIDTINVTIDPITANITGTTTICNGQSTILTGSAVGPISGVSGYAWNTGATTSFINVSPSTNTTYTVTITDGLGCTATKSTTVIVNPLPIPTVGSNSPVCVGATLNLNSGGGIGYSWIGPNAFTGNTQNPSITNVTAANGGIYTVTVTDVNSCTATASTTVIVNPLPIPTVGSNSPVCVGATLNLNSGGGTGYSWIGPNAFTGNTQNPSITNVTAANGGVYTVTVTGVNSCTATASTTVIVNPLPIPTVGSNSPVCVGATLNLNSGGGTGYSWIGPNAFTGNTQNPSITNVTAANGGVYTVTVTDVNSCTATASTTVIVNPLPIPTVGSNSPVCVGATLNLNSGGGIGYSWIGPNAFTGNTQNPSITNVTAANGGIYTVTVTDVNSCTATASTTVIVNPLPIPTVGSNSPVCVGATLNLNSGGGTGYSWIGPNAFTGNTQNPSITNVTAANGGVYTVTVTDVNSCTATASTTVIVNPLPIPTVGSNSPVCVGATLNLNSGGGTGYSWIGPNAFTGNTQNPSITNVTAANGGVYTVTVTGVNSCTATASTTVIVNPLPIPTVGSNSPVCVGATLNLNSGGGTGYSWIGPNAFTGNTQNPSITNVTAANGGVYTVTVTDVNSCTATASTTVIVNPLPIPTVGSNSPVCVGATLNLNSGGGIGYSWIGPNAFTGNTQNPSITNVTAANGGIYTVTVTDVNSCTATASTTVIVNPLPIPTVGSNSPVCVGATLNLNSGGGTGYSWIGPNAFTGNTQNPSITNVTAANGGVYTVTVTGVNSCTATASTTVIVNPLPIPTVGSNSPVCVGATLNLNSGGGTGYSWIGPNAFTGNTQNPSITNVTAANGGVYTVTVTDVNSCTATASTTVIVNPLPIPVSTNNGPLCVTNSLELSVSNAVSYLWSGPNGFTSSSQNPILSNVTMSENGVYTVTVTDINGCTASTSTNVSISPSLSFSPTSNSPVCEGGTLSFTSSPGMSHVWSGPNGFSSNIENPSISAVTLNAAGTYTVTVTSLQGCTGSAFLNVVVNPVPIVNLGNDTLVCGSISLLLDAGNAGSSYLWNDASSMQTLSVNGPGTYSVLVTDANGCSTTDQITITNETLPVVDLGLDQIVCEGVVVVLDATNSNATYLWNTGATTPTLSISTDGTYTVTVYKCNTSVTDQVQITVDEIELQVQNQVNPDCGMTNGEISLNVNGGVGTLTYIWQQLPSETGSVVSGLVEGSYDAIVTDAQGCTDAITVTLICISPEVIIPQFISPNGDGKNDVLVIQNLQIAYPRNSLKIYNRWGNEVYAASPYQNDWDGRCNTGLSLGTALLPAGTYFYVLDLHGDSSDVRSGFIELQP